MLKHFFLLFFSFLLITSKTNGQAKNYDPDMIALSKRGIPIKYSYQNIKSSNLRKLETVLLSKNDPVIKKKYNSYKFFSASSLALQIIGGGVAGYEIGKRISDNELNKEVFIAGISTAAVGIIFEVLARHKARKAIKKFNGGLYFID